MQKNRNREVSHYENKQCSEEGFGSALICAITNDLKNLQLDEISVLFPQLASFLKWFYFVNP